MALKLLSAKRRPMSVSSLIHPSLQKITIFTQLFKKRPTLSTICSKILDIHKNWNYITRFNTKLIHRNNILYCHKQHTYILSLFKYISSPLLHPSSMMPRDVVVDHSSKKLLLQRWHFSLLHAHPPDGQHHPSSLWVLQLCQPVSSSIILTGLSSWPPLQLFTGLSSWPPLQFFTGLSSRPPLQC